VTFAPAPPEEENYSDSYGWDGWDGWDGWGSGGPLGSRMQVWGDEGDNSWGYESTTTGDMNQWKMGC